ncbi:MAG: cell wall-associated NlpC family hydrolase [Candidatus Nitrosomirales archaeon]|jgi:cell wall-associated NlpC family hydrolase
MALIDDLNAIAPVAGVPPNTQNTSWVKELIDKRYQPQTERLKRSPMGFDFKREPFDPSSYYKQLGQFRDISRAATSVSQQIATNRENAQRQAEFEAARNAASKAAGGVNANFTYSNTNDNYSGKASGISSSIIRSGMKQLGKPYVFGAEGPGTFDCSGLMQYIFGNNGVRLPRTAAQQQRVAKRVNNPQPGDLVFYGYPAHHVALYLGNGKMLAAPHSGAVVRVQPVYGSPTYGRV